MQIIIPATVKPVYSHAKNLGDLLPPFAKEWDSKGPICRSGIDDPVIRIRTESLDPEGFVCHFNKALNEIVVAYVAGLPAVRSPWDREDPAGQGRRQPVGCKLPQGG
jgi:hypothetical protein